MKKTIVFDSSQIALLQKISGNFHFGCTSLIYRDLNEKVYLGRTLELTIDLPYQLAYLPDGTAFTSILGDCPPLRYATRHPLLAVVMPDRVPTAEAPVTLADLKVVEGLNAMGLTFSVLSYPTAGGGLEPRQTSAAVLAATDLGTWTLGQFATVAEVKDALQTQPVSVNSLALLGGAQAPFHYVLHDRSGASLVIEFEHGKMTLYDNPVGVVTNGPQFSWHLTNLDNYTFLTNVDQSSGAFGGLKVHQPDSGISTANLPSSNTSVGRFVRAVFYSQFAEKVSDPDDAVRTLAHIMNNFDRLKGISISPRSEGGRLEVQGLGAAPGPMATEYTSWTNLTDLNRLRFFLRTYNALNYCMFDLAELAKSDQAKILPVSALNGLAPDATARLLPA